MSNSRASVVSSRAGSEAKASAARTIRSSASLASITARSSDASASASRGWSAAPRSIRRAARRRAASAPSDPPSSSSRPVRDSPALASDPARLETTEARLFDIRALARKHRVEADALAALGEDMQAKLLAIEAGGERIAELEKALSEARAHYDAAAQTLREARAKAAERLDTMVAQELTPLKLDSARFRTALSEAEPGPRGIDRVEFAVSTNPGAPFGPLIKIASGGELSRFILALKVALAEAGNARTMIFDEVDRGVGGAVASAIGERLARLAEDAQVLVVTHSPQVAARAAHHYRIEKAHGENGTRTTVRKLTPDERREEIARMLSGAAITDEARAQAARLLEAA